MTRKDSGFSARQAIRVPSGGGRRYEMGQLTALFKADECETEAAYSVSEWILEPGQTGVGAHSHVANDEIFWVLEGAPDIFVGDAWQGCKVGDFIRVPRGILHDFRNHSDRVARLLNVFIPGGFERDMPKIVEWFAQNS